MITIFEDFDIYKNTEYSVGDIVICINNKNYEDVLTIGDSYLINKIYIRSETDEEIDCDSYKKENDLYIHRNKNNHEYYVDAMNIKNYQNTNVYAYRFVPELDYYTNKYNL